jgi:hypothetical protein
MNWISKVPLWVLVFITVFSTISVVVGSIWCIVSAISSGHNFVAVVIAITLVSLLITLVIDKDEKKDL